MLHPSLINMVVVERFELSLGDSKSPVLTVTLHNNKTGAQGRTRTDRLLFLRQEGLPISFT